MAIIHSAVGEREGDVTRRSGRGGELEEAISNLWAVLTLMPPTYIRNHCAVADTCVRRGAPHLLWPQFGTPEFTGVVFVLNVAQDGSGRRSGLT